jgi:sulfur transfer protein SufE
MAVINEIIGNFAVLDDWDDRYRYLIELGRELSPLAEAAHSDANKVQAARAKSGSTPLWARTARAARCTTGLTGESKR